MENGCHETKTKMRHPWFWHFQKAPRFVQKAAGFVQKAAGFVQKVAGFVQKAAGFVQKVAGFGKKVAGLVKTRLLLGNLHDGQLLFPIINADNLCIRFKILCPSRGVCINQILYIHCVDIIL